MATAYFLSPQFIKDYTFIDENVDEKNIRVAIKEAQDIRIKEFIGTGLYDEIAGQVVNSTLTSLNTTLLNDYIVPALKYWAIYEAAPFLRFRFTNKNIVTKNSDNSSTVDFQEFEKTLKFIEDKARTYSDRLVKYLLQNATSYPLYTNPGNGVDTIFPSNTGFDSDIYLGAGSIISLTPKKYYDERYKDL